MGIFKTPAQAQSSWNRLVRPAVLGCMASFIESTAPSGATVKVTSKGPLSLSVTGRRKAAYRIVANYTLGSEQAKVYLDLIMQGGGQADTVLVVTSIQKAPSAAFEAGLAKAIAGRLPK